MSRVTIIQRLYLVAVGFLAFTVGYWCYFQPEFSANGIPWTIPPLCATFLGAMYFSGGVYTVVSFLSRRWGSIQLFMPQCALWTGGLTIVSLFYLGAFDFSRQQTQLWFLAYIAFPIIGGALLWIHRREWDASLAGDTALPSWVKLYLRVQGTILIVLALALLFAPEFMQSLWAWRTGILMLQLYSMPLLAYGIGSWLMARLQGWGKIRNALIAHAVFLGLEFFACLRFSSLLNGPALSVMAWLGGLAVLTLVLTFLIAVSLRDTLPLVINQNSVLFGFTKRAQQNERKSFDTSRAT